MRSCRVIFSLVANFLRLARNSPDISKGNLPESDCQFEYLLLRQPLAPSASSGAPRFPELELALRPCRSDVLAAPWQLNRSSAQLLTRTLVGFHAELPWRNRRPHPALVA